MTAPLQPQAECSELPFWRVGELADREYRLSDGGGVLPTGSQRNPKIEGDDERPRIESNGRKHRFAAISEGLRQESTGRSRVDVLNFSTSPSDGMLDRGKP
jgi:hypothetical protein